MRVRSTIAALALVVGSMVAAAMPGRVVVAQDGLTAGLFPGTCGSIAGAGEALRPLQAQGQGADAIQTSFTTVNQALTALAGGGFTIVVDSGGTIVACGDVTGLPGNDLFIGLKEQNGSGYSGIAWLHARDPQTQISLFVGQGLGGGGGEAPFPPDPPVEPTPSGPEPPVEPTPQQPPVQPTPGQPSGQGATYTSPTYGYSITYNSTWEKIEETSSPHPDGGTIDYLLLSNGLSVVEIFSLKAFDGVTASEGITFWEGSLAGNTGWSNIVPRPGEAGGNDRQAFKAFDYTFTPEGGQATARSLWLGCWQVPGQPILLSVFFYTPTRGYEQQAADRDALMSTITIPG